jgi:hypothetical protein
MTATSRSSAGTAVSTSPVNGHVIGLIVAVCSASDVPLYPRRTANGRPEAEAT